MNMTLESLHGLLCPHCGVLFFATDAGVFRRCPVCRQRFKKTACELLEASLEVE